MNNNAGLLYFQCRSLPVHEGAGHVPERKLTGEAHQGCVLLDTPRPVEDVGGDGDGLTAQGDVARLVTLQGGGSRRKIPGVQ